MSKRDRPSAARQIRDMARWTLIGLVAITPWLFGCTAYPWRLLCAIGIFVVVALWATHAVLRRHFSYRPDAISLCLLGLVLFTTLQLIPIPSPLVRVFSPQAVRWHQELIPEVGELLPGEAEADARLRSRWLPLSQAPYATEDLLAQFLAVLLIYTAARNFAAVRSPRESLTQLAWAGFASGTALAAIGLAQYLSGERSRVYWTLDREASVFGPFTNKNHFAFQINLFLGLAGGLFITVARRPGGWRSPIGLGLLAGLGLMAVSVAFSQSRGGMLAAVLAVVVTGVMGWRSGRDRSGAARAMLPLVLGVAVVAGGLTAWLGWQQIADRLATLADGDPDARRENWKSVVPLVKQFPLVGVGGGALIWTEPTVRTRPTLGTQFNTLDNEYLEALVEGGIVRLTLTLALAIAAIWTAAAVYSRTGDPLALGAVYSLAAFSIHSAGDFGPHTPSVALTAAVIAAFVVARGREAVDDETAPIGARVNGRRAYLAAALLVIAGVLVVMAEWRQQRVETFRLAANAFPARAIEFLDIAARIRPNDPYVWNELTFAHLTRARQLQQITLAVVAGPAAFAATPEIPWPGDDPNGHIAAALNAARIGRAVQPLNPAFHLVPGTFTDRFTRSEPYTVHLARAKFVAEFDPEVRYAAGRASALNGDREAAIANWNESLARSPRRLYSIVRRAARLFPPDEIRARILPDDPAEWVAVTPILFPDAQDPAREDWLKAAVKRWATGPAPTETKEFIAWATTLETLGDPSATQVWQQAINRFPDEPAPRNRLAQRWESDERYDEALPLLEWLTERFPNDGDYRDRLAATRHALKLQADIDAKQE